MDLELSHIADWLISAVWPLGRVIGMVLVAPIFSAAVIPGRIRVASAVVLALALAPLLKDPPAFSPFSLQGVAILVEQVLIGVVIGFTLKLVFNAMEFGGQIIAMSMGLSYADIVDPQQGITVPVLSQVYAAMVALIFLALDGHLAMIQLLADSFTSLPPHAFSVDREILWLVASAGAQLFTGALHVALPAVSAVLIVNLGFGVMSRAAPALNLFAVGFPITMTLGMVAVWLSLRGLPNAFVNANEAAFGLLRDLIKAVP